MANEVIDFTALNQWLAKISVEASQLNNFKQKVAKTIIETIALSFIEEQSPYGTKWDALKWREGKILRDNRILSESISYSINSNSIDFGTNVPYASTHQYGRDAMKIYPTSKKALYFKGAGHPFKSANIAAIPARPFLPTAQGGLPKQWQDDITRVFKAVFLL